MPESLVEVSWIFLVKKCGVRDKKQTTTTHKRNWKQYLTVKNFVFWAVKIMLIDVVDSMLSSHFYRNGFVVLKSDHFLPFFILLATKMFKIWGFLIVRTPSRVFYDDPAWRVIVFFLMDPT